MAQYAGAGPWVFALCANLAFIYRIDGIGNESDGIGNISESKVHSQNNPLSE